MELLHLYGTEEQKERWLKPLLAGEIRSVFSMTGPAVTSLDATNIEGSIVRDGDEYVINAQKWWTTGAMDLRMKTAMAKIIAPRVCLAVLDRAIQLFGGAGVSPDTVLAKHYANTRTLRIV